MGKSYKSGKWYYDIWRFGNYLDLWSVNHTLAGCVLAGPLYALSVPFGYSLLISLIFIVGWEVYEALNDIKESWQNKSTDVATGVIGFLFIWYLFPVVTRNTQIRVYFSLLFIWLTLEIWGYVAYKATSKS